VVAGQEGLRGELKQQAVSVRVPLGRAPPLLLLLPILLRQQELPARLLLALWDRGRGEGGGGGGGGGGGEETGRYNSTDRER